MDIIKGGVNSVTINGVMMPKNTIKILAVGPEHVIFSSLDRFEILGRRRYNQLINGTTGQPFASQQAVFDYGDAHFFRSAAAGNAAASGLTDVITVTSTRDFLPSDSGKTIVVNSLFLPMVMPLGSYLPVGWNITLIQGGAGNVTFQAAGTMIYTMKSYRTQGQGAQVKIYCIKENTFVITGDLAPNL